jgi:hypothetical protein
MYIAPPLDLTNLQEQAKEALTNSVCNYRVSSYSFRGNYSFLDLEIQRSQYIRPKVTVYIDVGKLFKRGNYMMKYGTFFPISELSAFSLEFQVFLDP